MVKKQYKGNKNGNYNADNGISSLVFFDKFP